VQDIGVRSERPSFPGLGCDGRTERSD
jgi:hypothetical protein